MQDRDNKQRVANGNTHGSRTCHKAFKRAALKRRKVNIAIAEEIRYRYVRENLTQRALGAEYNISEHLTYLILKNKRYVRKVG